MQCQQSCHALQQASRTYVCVLYTSVISSLLTFSRAHEYRNTPQWNRFQRSSAIAPESTLNSTTCRGKKRDPFGYITTQRPTNERRTKQGWERGFVRINPRIVQHRHSQNVRPVAVRAARGQVSVTRYGTQSQNELCLRNNANRRPPNNSHRCPTEDSPVVFQQKPIPFL